MEEKKSLGKLLGETAGFTAIVYPIYSGLSALVDSNATFIDKIKDPETLINIAGLGTGYLIYRGVSELAKRYKISKRG